MSEMSSGSVAIQCCTDMSSGALVTLFSSYLVTKHFLYSMPVQVLYKELLLVLHQFHSIHQLDFHCAFAQRFL